MSHNPSTHSNHHRCWKFSIFTSMAGCMRCDEIAFSLLPGRRATFFSFPSPSHLLACVRPATARQRSESAGHLAVACPAALRSTRRCGLPNTGAKQGGLVLGPCCKIFFRCGMADAPEWGPLRRWMPNGEMTCVESCLMRSAGRRCRHQIERGGEVWSR